MSTEEHPAHLFTHRLAIMLECMLLDPVGNWEESASLLGEYQAAIQKWNEQHGDGHVSPLGKE